MRVPFTTAMAAERGISAAALKWGVKSGKWVRVSRGVYLPDTNPPTFTEKALCLLVATDGVAMGTLAGVLHGLDGMVDQPPYVTVPWRAGCNRTGVRHMTLPENAITTALGFRCTTGLQTLIDLAAVLNERLWEQALESALRKRLFTVEEIEHGAEELRPSRVAGMPRARRVLKTRPAGAPPTESLLETLAVQLVREAGLPMPRRQVEVFTPSGRFVARVDLAWPEYGVFLELDGKHHQHQLLHDASRETDIVAATGWRPGRFTWHEVHRAPTSTARKIAALLARDAVSAPTGFDL